MQSDIGGWIRDVRTAMEKGTRYGLLFGVYYVLVGLWLTVSTRILFGTPIYERDWDLLLVLDACRVDALAAVADEYDFLAEPTAVWSVGSTSSEWVSHTFDRQYATEISGTAYVTANPHSKPIFKDRAVPPQYTAVPFTWPDWNPVDADAFLELDEVWRYGQEEQFGVVPPATTTDRAISVGRELDPNRLLVHYISPTLPTSRLLSSPVTASAPVGSRWTTSSAAACAELRSGRPTSTTSGWSSTRSSAFARTWTPGGSSSPRTTGRRSGSSGSTSTRSGARTPS